ncbi:Chromatin-linked Adaptor for MSL Proteins (CLAMP) [Babesia bovis T2Bo]|uniref:Chromatin-linked Adaptor for MSL Proteins (CLAMP) n=1 Tax=Babesia bovis T2Bo TaxID=484906 RepID=UPI001C34C16A|nr:Chromatin-linked Adaptor for MSL Proteins (CLAMP) [Babesia bovis T2Bo]EDO06265.2 Chromatin-linked Adaptor for MSL Proteins (CLAMP) [Babesia bovis T2Bo]
MKKVSMKSKHKNNANVGTYSTHIPSFCWILAMLMTISGIVIHSTIIYTPHWRISKPIAYSYMHLGTRRQHVVGETRYGLQFINFNNGGFIQTWSEKVESVKKKGYTAIQHNEMVGKGTYRSFQGSYCPAACRNAIIVRMEGYEKMLKINNLLSLILILVCVLAALGVGWYILFDADMTVSGGLWVVAAVIGGCSTYSWNFYTNALWKTICSQQQIPFPAVGPNMKLSYVASALFVGGCLVLILSALFFHWRHTRSIQKMLQAHLQNKQNDMDPFRDPMAYNPMKPSAPMEPGTAPAQQTLNPGQLFSGIGFNQNQQQGYQYPQGGAGVGPSMWNTNVQY